MQFVSRVLNNLGFCIIQLASRVLNSLGSCIIQFVSRVLNSLGSYIIQFVSRVLNSSGSFLKKTFNNNSNILKLYSVKVCFYKKRKNKQKISF